MNFNNYALLKIVEGFAENNNLISNEEELSERFDAEIVESVVKEYSTDDTVAINEAFNNWTDALCKDGEIHPEQYNNYCYVGKYSE